MKRILFLLSVLLLADYAALSQPESVPFPPKAPARGLGQLNPQPSPAYREAVLKALIPEANRVASALQLAEKLPITRASLREYYVAPPAIAHRLQAVGNMTTENYTYFFSVSNKFSFLVKANLEKDYADFRRTQIRPIAQLDTNRAHTLATQLLATASMDVAALERDCIAHTSAFTPYGHSGSYFVPLYWVYWTKRGQNHNGSAASVELFEPTRALRQMHVTESRYILREPVAIPRLDPILSSTDESRSEKKSSK